jgi:hypothetical protein
LPYAKSDCSWNRMLRIFLPLRSFLQEYFRVA